MNALDYLTGARQMDPLTDAQMRLQAQATQQRGPYTTAEISAMAPFRFPSPAIPSGWAEWFKYGDEV
jgi:hypothetical protein